MEKQELKKVMARQIEGIFYDEFWYEDKYLSGLSNINTLGDLKHYFESKKYPYAEYKIFYDLNDEEVLYEVILDVKVTYIFKIV